MTLVQVETLFIEKLQEKYQLNKRDIKRAFKAFDKDGSGTLDVGELTKVIGLYLNGIDPDLIKELVLRYDVDGDGVISLDEFQQLLLSRGSPNSADWITVEHLTAATGKASLSRATTDEDDDDELRSRHGEGGGGTPGKNEYNSKIFLQNIKGSLLRKARESLSEGKVPKAERFRYQSLSFRTGCLFILEPLSLFSNRFISSMKNSDLVESVASDIFMKEFLPYLRNSRVGSTTNAKVSLANFSRVLLKFCSPGAPPPTKAVLQVPFHTDN
jgi:EF-hand domain pair